MIIHINVNKRVASYIPGDQHPVCGNETDTVRFHFDEEWQGKAITARFLWNGNKFHDEPVVNDTCALPSFLNVSRVLLGVFTGDGETGGALSSTRAEIPFSTSVRCGSGEACEIDVEAYTNEAKDAAQAAQAQAQAAEDFAAEAQTSAAAAKKSAESAAYYHRDLINMGLDAQLDQHNYRIGIIENHLKLASPMVVVSGNVETILLPENHQRYAKVEFLDCSCLTNYYCDGWYEQGVSAIRVNDAAGNCLRRIPIPVSSLPDYGVGQDSTLAFNSPYYDPGKNNRIVFEGGRAYYYHNVYMAMTDEAYGDPELRSPLDSRVDYTAYNAMIKMAEPEVIDITDIMGFDGFLDLYGAHEVVLETILGKTADGYVENDSCTEWFPARVRIIYEVEA